MNESILEQRLELLTDMINAFTALLEAEKCYLTDPSNKFFYEEVLRLKNEYQIATEALSNTIKSKNTDSSNNSNIFEFSLRHHGR